MADSVIGRIAAVVIGLAAFVVPEAGSSVLGVILIGWGLGADEVLEAV